MTERCGDGCVRPLGHESECRETWHRYDRCGARMPFAGERCARRSDHAGDHLTASAMADHAAAAARARAAA